MAAMKTALRTRILRFTLVVLTLLGACIVGVVAWSNYQTEPHRVAGIEARLSAALNSKAQVLVQTQALVLRSLVAGNALTDLTAVIEHSASSDPDIIYGVFINPEGEALAYTSPTTLAAPEVARRDMLEAWSELGIPAGSWTRNTPGSRTAKLFNHEIREVTHPVVNNSELLGVLVYGFSTARLREALAEIYAESDRTLRQLLTGLALAGVLATLLGLAALKIQNESELRGSAFNRMQQANADATKRLEQKTQAALEAARVKGEFLANMSHEIRTPMNGVLGLLRLMLVRPMDTKLRRFAETAEASAHSLMSIIDEILDLSKLEAGKFEIQNISFDPGLLMQEVAELHAGWAQDKGLELVYRKSSKISKLVIGDPDRLRQVLNNLVGNAIKFTEHGEIYVEMTLVEADREHVLLKFIVHDTGIGIRAEDQERLFDAFSQVDGSSVRKHGGTGLGLAISKRLVQLMGGEIGVTSEAGLGSEFWFSVRVEPVEQNRVSEPLMPKHHKALVVESGQRSRSIIEHHLRAWGMAHESFCDAHSARDRLARAKPEDFNVALVDSGLRGMSLEAFVKVIRNTSGGEKLPIIALTPLGAADMTVGALEDIAAQISKPLRTSELYDRIIETLTGEVLKKPHMAHVSPNTRARSLGTVLVVDDNEVNQFVAVEQLRLAGFDAECAGNGEEAVEKVKRGSFCAVLMDCQMPAMDGYTATREIRSLPDSALATVPIIALTARAMFGERERVLKAGMDDYLSKPFRPNALEQMLARYIKERVHKDCALDPSVPRSQTVCELFLSRAPVQIEAIRAVLEEGDSSLLLAHAHKLKGTCYAVGATEMAKHAQALEQMAERGNLSQADACMAALISEFKRVHDELQEELEARRR